MMHGVLSNGRNRLLLCRANHAVLFAQKFDNRFDSLREYLAEVDFVAFEQYAFERTHEIVFDFGGEIDLDYTVGNRLAHLRMRNARTAVEYEGCISGLMYLAQTVDVQMRLLLVKSMRRAYRNSQRIDTCQFHKTCRIGCCGKTATLLLAEFGDITQLRLDIGTVRTCQLHDTARGCHILVERTFAGIYHHRIETGIEASFRQFDRTAVVEMNPTLHTVVGNRLSSHGNRLFQSHIIYRTARELQQYGSLRALCGTHYGSKGLEIVEVGCQNGASTLLALFEKFFDIHSVEQLSLNRVCRNGRLCKYTKFIDTARHKSNVHPALKTTYRQKNAPNRIFFLYLQRLLFRASREIEKNDMMDNTSFDDIRAYYDDEIPAAMERIADDPMLEPAAKFAFPNIDIALIREAIRSCRNTHDIQSRILYPAIQQIIDSTIDNFTQSGLENVAHEGGQLFISNHRDISLDAFMLQYMLFSHDLPTTDIALGDNLLRPQIVADICRANNMVKIIRKDDVSPRECLENSRHLTEYIRLRIEAGRSMWIAQRNGRTKDGRDATDQGVLKMLGMSGDGDFAADFSRLHITPVAVSYQYETCDVRKALELAARATGEPYRKQPNEDFESIMCGISAQKGDVNITVCRPIGDDELQEMAALPKPEAYKALVEAIDKRITEAYVLHDTNYIAHDILHGDNRFADRYTAEQQARFCNRLSDAERAFGASAETAREIFLGIYANPVDSKEAIG